MIALRKRANPSQLMAWLAPLIALLITLLAGLVLFALLGVPVGPAFHAFFIEPVSSVYGLAELGVKAAPLIMIGVALSIGFRAQVWNIGAEGQLVLGAIAGSAVALALYDVDAWFVLPAMIIASILGGMSWAAIPAYLKTRFNVNEILTSLMLTYVAALLLSWLVAGPMRDPDGFNFPESRLFHDAATLPRILSGTRLHAGALVALGLVLAAWLLLSRTLLGFALKVHGAAPKSVGIRRFQANTADLGCPDDWRCNGRTCRAFRSGRSHRATVAQYFTRVWLYRHYRGIFGPPSSGGCSVCRAGHGLVLSGG